MGMEGEITRLLREWRDGDHSAFERIFPIAYRELHERAHRQLTRRRPGETLSTTALVHEAYLKLADNAQLSVQDRAHFFAVAARAMRQIIIDHARRASAQKRSDKAVDNLVDPADLALPTRAAELVTLDEALTELASLNERLSRVVELRFFAGLSVEETAELLESSPRTVKRDWAKARAFLYDAINESSKT